MSNLKLTNSNFFFLKDSYPILYNKCKKMDLAIVNEEYNKSVALSGEILSDLVNIILNTDNSSDDLSKLIERICKFNNTASEICIYLNDIRINSEGAINHTRHFSHKKAVDNAEKVHEVTAYFLVDENMEEPVDFYNIPASDDDWVKMEKANLRSLDEFSSSEVISKSQKRSDEIGVNKNKKVVIELKTDNSPIITITMPEEMMEDIKPTINIDYLEEDD